MIRRASVVLGSLSLLALAGCFEPPVVELLTFDFAPDGSALATLEVSLAGTATEEPRGVRRRIEEREQSLLDGVDPWLDRFATIGAAEDGLAWRRTGGRLRSFQRWARVTDADDLGELFAGDAVTYSFDQDGERAVLLLVPTRATRATRRERQRVEQEVAHWTVGYADYLAAAFALDGYLTGRPGRAVTCWRAVLGEKEEGVEPEPDEEVMVTALADAMTELLQDLEVDRGEGFSLDERVRKVFHPLSAQFAITLPIAADEVEGFAPADEHAYFVPELSLIGVLQRLEGRWLAPDPLRALLDHLRAGGDEPLAVAPFAAGPIARAEEPPGTDDVVDALLTELRPPPVYHLAWRLRADRSGAAGPR